MDVGEITFVMQNLNNSDETSNPNDQFAFVKRERKLQGIIQMFLNFFYPLLKFVDLIMIYINKPQYVNYIILAFDVLDNSGIFVCLCICFGMLYHLLNTKHHSEFQRIKN